MEKALRIGIFVGAFPVISETFILRQITGLLDLGHKVRIFSDTKAEAGTMHPAVDEYDLLKRTTYMEMPTESAPWEMPVWPIRARTWLPGSDKSISNWRRFCSALPVMIKALVVAPQLARRSLDHAEYGYRAASLSALYRLAKVAERRSNFDVLHAHFGPVGESFRFARKLCRAPFIVSFHGYDFTTIPRKEGVNVYQKLFATADAVTVNSNYTRGRVKSLGCPSEKLRLLPVGLDPAEFDFRPRSLSEGEPLKIVTVARLVEIKGHEFVIQALAQLQEQQIPFRYDVVGDGSLRPALEKLVRELGLAERVTFHGAQPSGAVKKLLEQAHVFVLASVTVQGDQEGQGLVLQEAQASGLPVIATRHGAFPEGILDGESGYLVPERDAGALAERLVFLYSHPEQWPQMGEAGREFVVKKYDIRQLNQQLVDLYRDVISQYHAKQPA